MYVYKLTHVTHIIIYTTTCTQNHTYMHAHKHWSLNVHAWLFRYI